MITCCTALLSVVVAASPVLGQEFAIKGAIVRSAFDVEGITPFDGALTATSLGGHVRFTLGRIALQPELHIVTRGGTVDETEPTRPDLETQQLRLEYLEIPLLLVVPVRFGEFEAFALGGPMVALESRCRYVYETEGLKTSAGCDPPSEPLFRRNVLDYGAIAGAGLSRRIGSGRVLLEARHTWGMNDIVRDSEDFALKNRSFSLMLGYVVSWTGEPVN